MRRGRICGRIREFPDSVIGAFALNSNGEEVRVAANPFMPQSSHKGHDYQEWQRLRRQMTEKPAPAPSTGGSKAWSSGPAPYIGGGPAGSSMPPAGGGGAAGPGIGEMLGEQSFKLSSAVVDSVWPLKACIRLGQKIADAGRWWRIAAALPCALIAGGFAAGQHAEGVLVLAALAVGLGVGWMLPTVLGALILLAAHLTGLAIGLACIAGVIALAWWVITAAGH